MSFYIPIILGSTRRDRESIKPARFALKRMEATPQIDTELLDLKSYNFPILEERLRFRDDPPPGLREFSLKISRADCLVIVSPEYNHGYPGVLKNALDYLLPEYQRKPFAFITVSSGAFGGINCLNQLQLVCMGMGGFPVPASFTVPRVQYAFDDEGNPTDRYYEIKFEEFIREVLWYTEAIAAQKARDRAEDRAA